MVSSCQLEKEVSEWEDRSVSVCVYLCVSVCERLSVGAYMYACMSARMLMCIFCVCMCFMCVCVCMCFVCVCVWVGGESFLCSSLCVTARGALRNMDHFFL